MRKIKYSELLKRSAERSQRAYDQLSTDDAAFLENFIDSRLKRIWEYIDWPDLVLTEKRAYRQQYSPLWYATTAVATQLYDGNAKRYVISLKSTTNDPSDSAETINDDWAELKSSYSFDDYSDTTTYAVGAQVYYYLTDKYYQVHTAPSGPGYKPAIEYGSVPVTTTYFEPNAAHWGEVPRFDRYIDYEQPWETNKIGNVTGVFNASPRLDTTSDGINFFLTNQGIQVPKGQDRVWVQHRKRVPDATYTAHDSTKADYAVADVVKYPASGADYDLYECATAATVQTPGAHADWTLVEIPYIFKDYIASGAAADMLQLDEKVDLAFLEENRADRALEHELDKLNRQQRQTEQFNVLTRTN